MKNGTKLSGTYKIVNNEINIYNEYGYGFSSGQLEIISENEIAIKSWFSTTKAKRVIK